MATKQEQQEQTNLGSMISDLVDKLPPGDASNLKIGKIIHGLIAASVKAVYPGDQTEENTHEAQQKAQKAFQRKLARKVAKL